MTDSSQPQAPVHNGEQVDPTRNVLDKVDDAVRRQDDLRELQERLFRQTIEGVEKRMATEFALRDTAAEKLSIADKTAIAAALQAQKEDAAARNESNAIAIAKSEAGFTKQIDGIGALIASASKATDDKISDIKARLDRGDGHGGGLRDGWGYIVGAAGLVALLVSFAGRLG